VGVVLVTNVRQRSEVQLEAVRPSETVGWLIEAPVQALKI